MCNIFKPKTQVHDAMQQFLSTMLKSSADSSQRRLSDGKAAGRFSLSVPLNSCNSLKDGTRRTVQE